MSNISQVIKSFDKQNEAIKKIIIANVWKAWDYYEWEVVKVTPLDTWDLQTSIARWEVKIQWDRVYVRVWTSSNYWLYVEYWITWKSFNYRQWTRIFKTWTWARMFRDTLEKEKNNIKQILKW